MACTLQIPPDTIIGQKYRIVRKIGSGSFGEIYSGTVVYPDAAQQQQVAIKFEKKSARCPQLRHEFKVYRELQGCAGIGRVMYFGTYRDCNVMVMELLGPSLEDLFNQCSRRFSLKTVLQLADQLLERAETLHDNHLIHRDIKPANFTASFGDQSSVFCIDFGLSKRYRHPHTMQHIPYREGRSLTGTPRYASVANHRGVETSRRDDLESIGYILVYFLLGKLPWQGLKLPANAQGTASQKHRLILDKKQLTPLSELCRGCPVEFQEFIQYCRDLQFDAKPNMNYARNLFRDLYKRKGFENPKAWDWDPPGRHAAHAHATAQAVALAQQEKAAQQAQQAADKPPRATVQERAAADKVTVTMPVTSAQLRPSTATDSVAVQQASVGGSQHNSYARSNGASRPWSNGEAGATLNCAAAIASRGGGGSSQATQQVAAASAHPSRSEAAAAQREQYTATYGAAYAQQSSSGLAGDAQSGGAGAGASARECAASTAKSEQQRTGRHSAYTALSASNPLNGAAQALSAHAQAAPVQRTRPSTAPSAGDGRGGKAGSLFWKSAEDGARDGEYLRKSAVPQQLQVQQQQHGAQQRERRSEREAREQAAAGGQAWGEGPRRPRPASSGARGGTVDVRAGGYVMDHTQDYGSGYHQPTHQLGYLHGESGAAPTSSNRTQQHLVAGSLSLVRHRRASGRDRPNQQAKYRPTTTASASSAQQYQYPQYGLAQESGNQGGLWGQPPPQQPAAASSSRHTAWNTSAAAAQRAKQPSRPASAARAAVAQRGTAKQAAPPPARTRHRY